MSLHPHQFMTGARFSTCRYWAFSPSGCPDNGICNYAHRDTGRLASHLVQTGTCRPWKTGHCSQGPTCFYEHRHTGVDGLYQGRKKHPPDSQFAPYIPSDSVWSDIDTAVELSGEDFEIANAAAKSGFNINEHVALFDLIWSMKRVTRRIQDVARRGPPPPKNPVYPDRYRPSGIGDNTKRKRPHNESDNVTYPLQSVHPQNNHGSTQRFVGVKQGKKKKKKDKKQPVMIQNGIRAQPHVPTPVQYAAKPIVLPIRSVRNNAAINTGEGNFRSTPAKRQKINTTGAYQVHLPPAGFAGTQTAVLALTKTPVGLSDQLLQRLADAKRELGQVQTGMVKCRLKMEETYDTHSVRMSREAVLPSLERLSANMNTIHDEAMAGVGELEQAMDMLGDDKDLIL